MPQYSSRGGWNGIRSWGFGFGWGRVGFEPSSVIRATAPNVSALGKIARAVPMSGRIRSASSGRMYPIWRPWPVQTRSPDQEIGRIVAWSEKQAAEIRMRYVNEEHAVASLVERLNAKNNAF